MFINFSCVFTILTTQVSNDNAIYIYIYYAVIQQCKKISKILILINSMFKKIYM